ncbi:MAG: phenylalanine--tRNA ligase subunit beta [Solirubrobacteraceae bacterium]
MRLPLEWLHDYCRPELSPDVLASRLTLAGLELERLEHHGVGTPGAFVVGHVLEASAHPDADRLSVCLVDIGTGEPTQIVCGAPNVAAGQAVAVARPGAVMPDGSELGVATLRGVQSHGMILAEDELGIGTDHAGILVLGEHGGDAPAPGTPLAEVLPIATEVLELETFHNRPDTLGIYGLAREVHAATGAELGPPPWSSDAGSEGEVEGVQVEVQCPELCPRFTARRFEDVTIGPSPPWLKARLMAMGQRPISNVVDITNYAMLLTGQPLHAFDWDRVAGGRLVVRRAQAGETLTTLDGAVRALDADMVVICDDEGPTSIAGVMGGARSEVGDSSSSVVMEVATWNGGNIHRTATRLGLRSEASARFEKQLSPAATLEAQSVATALMIELCGATVAPGTVDVGGPPPPPDAIRLQVSNVESVLGVGAAPERCAELLEHLGFAVTSTGIDELGVAPPHHRGDVRLEEDLIEEIARIDVLERLPATLPAGRPGARLTPAQRVARTAMDALVHRGLDEIAGWSFTAPSLPDRLRLPAGDGRRAVVRVANPMSEELSVLRTTLIGSLLDAAAHNVAHGTRSVALCEQGAVYLDMGAGLPDQPTHFAALLAGPGRTPSWREADPPPADVFAAKGVLAGVLDTLRVPWTVEAATEPFLHPGRAGRVLVAGAPAGWVGEIHPLVARAWDLEGAAAWEVSLDAVIAAATETTTYYKDLLSHPGLRQDLAVVVSDDVAAARVLDVVRDAGGPLLVSARVFDVYRGEQIGAGRASLAIALEFRAADRTLTDAEVASPREAIAAALRAKLGGELRV